MSIKSRIKNSPLLYPIVFFVKYKIYLPLKRGHVSYYIKYSLFEKRKEIENLIKHGFESIEPMAPCSWRIGKEKDKAFRRYYTAVLNGKKCFIKVGVKDSTVKNEAEVYNAIKDADIDFIAKPLVIDLCFAEDTVMVSNEFIDGLKSLKSISDYEQFKELCSQFQSVLSRLKALQIVHADIHKANMMLTAQGKLILLDFGISIVGNKQKQVNYRARRGTFFRESPDGTTRVYDDAYSFVKMFETLDLDPSWKDAEEFCAIEKLQDDYSVTVIL